ncbi:hypothetical protein PINS_up021144 [Pythium insidiosum]|nr:hypothetical protein PINS_up021144 [Pythium insidiosum]
MTCGSSRILQMEYSSSSDYLNSTSQRTTLLSHSKSKPSHWFHPFYLLVVSSRTAARPKRKGHVPHHFWNPLSPPQQWLSPPRLLQVFPVSSTEIVVTWEPTHDVGVTKYQVQYAKNRFAAIWWTVKQDIPSETLKCRISDLTPGSQYLFRVRAMYGDQWSGFSEASDPCKTLDEPSEIMNEAEPPVVASPPQSLSTFLGAGAVIKAPSSSPPQLRTGSTFLDKAVAAASKLALSRAKSIGDSADNKPPSNQETAAEEAFPLEGDIVDAILWKAELECSQQIYKSYNSVRYIATVTEATEVPTADADESSTNSGEHTTVTTWNRVGERELVVTSTTLYALAMPSSNETTDVVVETKRPLARLAKITSKKTVPNSVVFHFKGEAQENVEQLCFVVENKAECIALIRENYQSTA